MKILLVEDDASVRESLRAYLHDRHELVLEAAHGQEALSMIEAHQFDTVIADIRMPILDGLGLLRILSRTHPALRVILVTGHADIEVAIEASRHHAYDFIRKPYDLTELDGVLRKLNREMILEREIEQEKARANAAERIASLAGLTITIMHEVNNPNTVIIGSLQFLTKHLLPALQEETVREVLQPHLGIPIDGIRKTMHSMETAAARLRDVASHIPAGCSELCHDRMARLEDCLERAIARSAVEGRRALLEIRTGDAQVLSAVHSEELTMLFAHLITNAMEATAGMPDAEVTVGAELSGNRCVITIRDNGVGASPEMIKRMCEPFAASGRERPGRGLGLWIAHRLTAKAGGRLEWDNLPEGTAFRLSLPCSVEHPREHPAAVGSAAPVWKGEAQ